MQTQVKADPAAIAARRNAGAHCVESKREREQRQAAARRKAQAEVKASAWRKEHVLNDYR
jgi:hypothetical protein